MQFCIFSLRNPTDDRAHPVHREIRARVTYLPEYLYHAPPRVLRGVWAARRRAGLRAACAAWLRDLRRDPTANRVRRLGQALVLANELPAGVRHLHVHFLHTPASVVRYAALLTGLPWTCSAHAKDIWTLPEWEKREKLAECRWLVTCTEANRRHLRALAPHPDRVELIYHGLDFSRFPEPPGERPPRDGTQAEAPVVLLSVGRAVEKKGYEDLLAALAALPAACSWRFVHVGGGPLLPRLQERARRLGIAERVRWLGPQPQEEVLRQYRTADLFVLACRITGDGDRDGLPNVLLEAQSQKLPCVSTRLPGIRELVEDERTGLLVPEGDVAALAGALARMVRDPSLRQRLADAGFRRVRTAFALESGIERLAAKLAPPPALAAALEGLRSLP
ncbi:MAG: glycosyltransferase family 4 protein [Gammaproteobacteria bacterium]|nr:glycosyltransferase family 4 protein [Gammaproteobacteria bacterium]NIR85661.1 glycosyltransferase family 4 protein [Gammaproteobacteria bacterium]NIR90149.1 glycosyltransferase family 4 protein [Gammaproteobacteria bacterium]NIU06795.1 glycosyltransferase family 4 protein [Gammaproteobacteria bacterium]NIV53728.1 glycosyltransferase [Gammaproteobacteria bacterium]